MQWVVCSRLSERNFGAEGPFSFFWITSFVIPLFRSVPDCWGPRLLLTGSSAIPMRSFIKGAILWKKMKSDRRITDHAITSSVVLYLVLLPRLWSRGLESPLKFSQDSVTHPGYKWRTKTKFSSLIKRRNPSRLLPGPAGVMGEGSWNRTGCYQMALRHRIVQASP